jgi:hypothetical protein
LSIINDLKLNCDLILNANFYQCTSFFVTIYTFKAVVFVLIFDDRIDDEIFILAICELRQPTIAPPELFILMLWV